MGSEYRSDPATTAVAVPIYKLLHINLKMQKLLEFIWIKRIWKYLYQNYESNLDVLEKRVAALEGGLAAVAVGSGQAASAFVYKTFAKLVIT